MMQSPIVMHSVFSCEAAVQDFFHVHLADRVRVRKEALHNDGQVVLETCSRAKISLWFCPLPLMQQIS